MEPPLLLQEGRAFEIAHMMDLAGGGMGLMMLVMMIFWAIFGLVLLALAAAALVWLVRALRGQGSTGQVRGRSHPVEELDRRYAAGELSRQEYLRCKEDVTRP